jgi:polyisoprenoid-binding protein YceI
MKSPFALLLLFATSAFASTATLDPGAGSVEFTAIGRPSMLKIVGKGPGPTGTLDVTDGNATGTFDVDLKDVTTGISMRDHHMKEKYLQVDKYPQAEFKLSSLKLPKPLDGSDASFKDVPFEGTFKVHGVEKPVKGTADLSVESSKLKGTANFAIKVTDYGIDIPKFAGITMAEDVKVTVQGAGPLSGGKK